MTVNALKYRPQHVTQYGVDTSLDDCAACVTLVCWACATSGEYTTTQYGREMGKAQLHAKVRALRRSVGDNEGGLNHAQLIQMALKAGFPAPRTVNLKMREVVQGLQAGYVYSVGGNPADIKGASPRKRCDCGHEWGIIDYRVRDGQQEILLYDPLRNAPPRKRGEWVPISEVRQMAWKDSENVFTTVLEYTRGAWTKEALYADDVAAVTKGLRQTIREQRKALEDCVSSPIDIPAIKERLTVAMNAQQEAWSLLN